MKRNTKIIIAIYLLAVLSIFNGCSTKEVENDLLLGRYISSEDRFSWVTLEANNKFTISFDAYSSYLGHGDFLLVDGMLTFNDAGINKKPKQYKFKIDGDSMKFESGEFASKFFIQGEVFNLIRK